MGGTDDAARRGERVLVGYSMRSGSTLLQHILGQHDRVTAFSDLSSILVLGGLLLGWRPRRTVCVKPIDVLFLVGGRRLLWRFDRRVWITRDPRDSYLSAIESGYAYLLWPRGRREAGIDVGLLRRWRRIHRHVLEDPESWYLLRYEDLAAEPEREIARLLEHLELPSQQLIPFAPFNPLHGGDYKVRRSRTVSSASVGRHRRHLGPQQLRVFERLLGAEMRQLGYSPGTADREGGEKHRILRGP